MRPTEALPIDAALREGGPLLGQVFGFEDAEEGRRASVPVWRGR